MKKSHIIAIVVIAIAAAVVISTTGDAGTYVSFSEARQMAENGKKGDMHVVGHLKKDAMGTITGVNTSADHLSFSFELVDEKGNEQTVYYNEPMPPDFMKSEQVVVVGSYEKPEIFVASKILMKCPSKYQEKSVEASM